jgi:glucokinase
MTDHYLGIDVGGSSIKGAVVTADGEVLHHLREASAVRKGPEAVKQRIAGCATRLRDWAAEQGLRPRAAGVGAAGVVDDRGVVHHPPNFPGWRSENLEQVVGAATGLPTVVANDGDAAALGAAVFGAGRGFRDFALLTLGTGVGGGLILNGELYRGAGFAAGEVGHIIVFPGGEPCNCGARGCLEQYVGIAGIVRRAAAAGIAEPGLAPQRIHELALAGDERAVDVLRETGEIVGLAVASVFNLLNLEAVIIGGGVAAAGDLLIDPIREAVARQCHRSPLLELEVVPAELGERAGVIGAAALALREHPRSGEAG